MTNEQASLIADLITIRNYMAVISATTLKHIPKESFNKMYNGLKKVDAFIINKIAAADWEIDDKQ